MELLSIHLSPIAWPQARHLNFWRVSIIKELHKIITPDKWGSTAHVYINISYICIIVFDQPFSTGVLPLTQLNLTISARQINYCHASTTMFVKFIFEWNLNWILIVEIVKTGKQWNITSTLERRYLYDTDFGGVCFSINAANFTLIKGYLAIGSTGIWGPIFDIEMILV